MTDAHLARLLAQEEQDGRFATPEAKAGQNNGRTCFANMHRFDLKDAQHWMENRFIWRWARCCWAPPHWKSTPARLKALTSNC